MCLQVHNMSHDIAWYCHVHLWMTQIRHMLRDINVHLCVYTMRILYTMRWHELPCMCSTCYISHDMAPLNVAHISTHVLPTCISAAIVATYIINIYLRIEINGHDRWLVDWTGPWPPVTKKWHDREAPYWALGCYFMDTWPKIELVNVIFNFFGRKCCLKCSWRAPQNEFPERITWNPPLSLPL